MEAPDAFPDDSYWHESSAQDTQNAYDHAAIMRLSHELGCPGNIALVTYIDKLERRILALETEILLTHGYV